MRDIIKKILKESINPQIDIGDIFITSGTKEKDLIRITDIRCGGTIRDKEFNTPDWGKQVIEYDGCDLMYQVSTDQGITWEYESEGGHWVDVAWIKNLIEKGWWELLHKNMDFFDILNESKEEDDFEWARELVSVDYSDIKWIRTDDGKRFKNLRDRLGYGNSSIIPWSRFNGWDNWWKVDKIELIDDKLCFITSLNADPIPRSLFYFTPVEEYNQNEMSSSVERPKVGDEKRKRND